MSLTTGQSLSFYEILGPLGAGGMGEVYRARDTRLEREVALKVLPEELAGDEERLKRFEREAKSLASLSHANVAQVFGIDQVGDTCFMAMELVPGEDLAARLARGALPLAEALDVCRQIAEGVEAAHEAGVIHRDLKPANVVITPGGKVKVLDFGLAKPMDTDSGLSSNTDSVLTTGEGRFLGTPTYMAPEQARGKPIDKRVDVWAFGCVLYESLTGKRAFDGETVGDVLAAVLEREPDWSALPSGPPAHVRALLARCLDKHSHTRLQDMGEARIALTGGGGDELAESAVTVSTTPLRARLLVITLSLLLILGLLAAWQLWPEVEPKNPLSPHWSPLNLRGSEFCVDISGSGETLIFGSDRDGVTDLWRCSIQGGDLENLTQGKYPFLNEGVRPVGFGVKGGLPVPWFGHSIEVEAKSLSHAGATLEMAVGPETVEPDWTRDGSRVVYHTNEWGDPTYVHQAGGAKGEPLVRGVPGEHLHYHSWSFDEEWIYYCRGNPMDWEMDLYRLRADGTGEQQRLTTEQLNVSFPTPIDEHTVLFLGHDKEGAGPWLWSLDLRTLKTLQLTAGLQRCTSLAASADGRTVVATVANPTATLYQVPIRREPVEVVRQDGVLDLPGVPSVRALAPRYVDGVLFYLSSRGGGDGLYMVQDGMPRALRPEKKEPLVYLPSVSLDGTTVALIRRSGPRRMLTLLSVESQSMIEEDRVPDLQVHGSSCWDPTGMWIVVAGEETDDTGSSKPGLFKISVEDGSWLRLADGFVSSVVWSPTEDLIVYGEHLSGPWVTLRGVSPEGNPVELQGDDISVRGPDQFRFLPDGSGLVFMTFFQEERFAQDFWQLDLASGKQTRLTELKQSGTIRTFDISSDGTHIVFDVTVQNSDVVVIPVRERRP